MALPTPMIGIKNLFPLPVLLPLPPKLPQIVIVLQKEKEKVAGKNVQEGGLIWSKINHYLVGDVDGVEIGAGLLQASEEGWLVIVDLGQGHGHDQDHDLGLPTTTEGDVDIAGKYHMTFRQ